MDLYLIRHGETEWSRTRRHTGRSDLDLTDQGRRQAAALAPRLAHLHDARVVTSPLRRAHETCRLAGLGEGAIVDDRVQEWDYGAAEGRTTADIRTEVPGWSVWTHPCDGGESLDEVGERIDSFLADIDTEGGDVAVFAHAHLLRILAARWLGFDAVEGRRLMLEPASVSVLGHERENRRDQVLERNRLTGPNRRAFCSWGGPTSQRGTSLRGPSRAGAGMSDSAP